MSERVYQAVTRQEIVDCSSEILSFRCNFLESPFKGVGEPVRQSVGLRFQVQNTVVFTVVLKLLTDELKLLTEIPNQAKLP